MTLRGLATVNHDADDAPAAVSWYAADLLGTAPYVQRTGQDDAPAYVELRVGDLQVALGIVDDLAAAVDRFEG
jgi:hypothetical protein